MKRTVYEDQDGNMTFKGQPISDCKNFIWELIFKLKDYEDTGLTSMEIDSMKYHIERINEVINAGKKEDMPPMQNVALALSRAITDGSV